MKRSNWTWILCLAGLAGVVATAGGQTNPLPSHDVLMTFDSGDVANTTPGPRVVYSRLVQVEDARWMRLSFSDVQLAGEIGSGTESYLIITSLYDGAHQYLNAHHVADWQNTSAYFNGDAVLVELIAYPQTGANRVALAKVTAGEPDPGQVTTSICGPTDDRQLSYDRRGARMVTIGCSVWLIGDCNYCFLTAGHCNPSGSQTVQFNVPLSNSDGSINHPHPKDQYAVEAASVQGNGGQGTGNDWAYFGVRPNSNTGLMPIEVQESHYVTQNPPPVGSNNIRITGYGTVTSPVDRRWNQVQKTHVGPFVTNNGTLVQYRTDTTGGNSGSPVIWEEQGVAVGIHTHGGCSSTGGQNSGTGFNHSGLQTALAAPRGVCLCRNDLSVTPDQPLHPWGDVGGPFAPNAMTFTLRNNGLVAMEYEVTVGQAWLTVTNGTGTIPPNSTVTVPVALNANANSLGAGEYNDTISFVNKSNGQGNTTRAVVLKVGGPSRAYAWNMDTDPGWTAQGKWAWGKPTGKGGDHGKPDPMAGFTGDNVYGYNLDGDYDPNMAETHLATAAIDCSDLTGVWLHFYRWLGVESFAADKAFVRVSNNGTDWTTVWQNGAKPTSDGQWVFQDFDISAVADGQATVYVRWTMGGSDGVWTYCGWNLDDVSIWGRSSGPAKPGDMNCDGNVDFGDIDGFVLALSGREGYEQKYPDCRYLNADCNNDGAVNFGDINPFVELLGR